MSGVLLLLLISCDYTQWEYSFTFNGIGYNFTGADSESEAKTAIDLYWESVITEINNKTDADNLKSLSDYEKSAVIM